MLATQDLNHVAEAKLRLLEQYKGKPLLQGLLAAFVAQVQDLENAIYALDHGRELFDGTTFPASGAQLDGIGEIVGIARQGLDDATYLIFILGKIAENASDGTCEVLSTIMTLLFNASACFTMDESDASVSFDIGDPQTDPSLYTFVEGFISKAIAGGVRLDFIAKYVSTDFFAFSSAGKVGTGGGFGTVTDGTVGGGLAALVFQNSAD